MQEAIAAAYNLVLPCGYVLGFHCEGWRAEYAPFRCVGLEERTC